MQYCNRLNAEAEMRIQLSLVKPDIKGTGPTGVQDAKHQWR